MRFELNQSLFAVQFGYSSITNLYGMYRQPLLHDEVFPCKCNFVALTVQEHHKVRGDFDEQDAKPQYDGFLLKDEHGKQFSNQYPRASYGQVTDTADRRFFLYNPVESELVNSLESNPETIVEYHLLSDLLENIQRGIKQLSEREKDDWLSNKIVLLTQLYDMVVAEFTKAYPTHQIHLCWEPIGENSKLIWPKVQFTEAVYHQKEPEVIARE